MIKAILLNITFTKQVKRKNLQKKARGMKQAQTFPKHTNIEGGREHRFERCKDMGNRKSCLKIPISFNIQYQNCLRFP